MKTIIFTSIMAIALYSSAQKALQPDAQLAGELSALCCSYTFEDLYGSDKKIVPKGYDKLFTSTIIGMDNKYQVYKKKNTGIINFRGSTDNIESWMENMYSAMIPAKGTITIQGKNHAYCFAKKDEAAVHAGYALALIFLSEGLINQVNSFNKQGIFDIIITGHSQGGALATMTRSYLENLPEGQISDKNTFRTYAFANPMCGNKIYAEEYDAQFSLSGTSFRFVNPKDPVPFMPLSPNDNDPLSIENVSDILLGHKKFDAKKLGQELLMKLVEDKLPVHVERTNKMLQELISLKFGSVEMPSFTEDVRYYSCGTHCELEEFYYPVIGVTDEDRLENKISSVKTPDGSWIRKEPLFYQHKPYNYHVAVLKKFDEKHYKRTKVKFLPENL